MNLKNTFIILLIFCQGLYAQTSDFTQEGLFTSGIEGPATDKKGIIYAVNFEKEGTIGKVDENGEATLFVNLKNGSIGNGIRFDKEGNMYVADYVNHNILLIENGSKEVEVFAHQSSANQPNDLAISPQGIIYASDPNWKESTGNIWKVDANGFQLLEENMGTTNGIEVSPDGKKLYVNESVQRKIWQYSLDKQGNISEKKLFHQFSDFGLDGMRCDDQGNLYVCRYDAGEVVIINPDGIIIRSIQLKGKKPTNLTFGGKENRWCYVTLADRGCFEVFEAKYPGRQ